MIILGGAFLLTPGFITDAVGLLLLIPPTRAIFRGMVARLARRRAAFTVRAPRLGLRRRPGPRPGGAPAGPLRLRGEAPARSPSRAASCRRATTMPNGETLALELGAADGPTLRVEWDLEALRELNAGSHPAGVAGARPSWRLEAEPGWDRAGVLRLISASFDDGSLLAVAALRPLGVEGHDAEAVGAVLVAPQGEAAQLHEALLSTEYGPDGRARRLGLELYESSTDPAVRVVADRVAGAGEMPTANPRR